MMKNNFLCALLMALIASIADVSAMAVKEAPSSKFSLWDETKMMLDLSTLVYNFAEVVKVGRHHRVEWEFPEDFPVKNLTQFEHADLDLRRFGGVSFGHIFELLKRNDDKLMKAIIEDGSMKKADTKLNVEILEEMKDLFKSDPGVEDDIYLSTFRSVDNKKTLVYGIVKDTRNKKIVVSFRGAMGFKNGHLVNRDWNMNLQAFVTDMDTPEKVKDKMKGKTKERVLVHRGFSNYLFNNAREKGQQKYDEILDDLKDLMEEGYSVYVTGHSLGAALATMFAFAIAGGGEETDFIPRPISCITFAAPFLGTNSFREAFEQEEKDGLIRSLRVTVAEDPVPTVPFVSISSFLKPFPRAMKHCGINLVLPKGAGVYSVAHSSLDGAVSGLSRKLKNSPLTKVGPFIEKGAKYHLTPMYHERLLEVEGNLEELTIDGLYKDKTVVAKDFLEGEL
mmetsp:Transcript_22425/g.47373  ORF Transcript_22425/g.47373 Transcript_22425/m.47373 type:complete len:450 (+) Transcript_22425:263-1612(+)|eukprot:CAMPEP_0201118064 /NCGR_PEP_ID=MMETSP0850-20130426/2169_1 /ASSEMBLY_ACC=CAM_ASM_000622 /TAXON_ID=183588 /ORGANISM="Pseudo-nitzschia fraudulenta, Strain WWA7" /LENGTH=449 /DNA_ID=CAMNT_0047382977 /DNA_START=319 /DNA_END=1668 /DNA_ORIENTATION=+